MVSRDPKVWFEGGRQEALNVSILCAKGTVQDLVQYALKHALSQYPYLKNMDFLRTFEELNEERLESEPDYQVYPELKGLRECHRERQRGFMEAAHCTKAEMATYYNWHWHETRRLHPRCAGQNAAESKDGCTVVYFQNSKEGPILGRNFDHPMSNIDMPRIPDWNCLIHSPISSIALCDEEPGEIFPANPFELMSSEIKADINKVVDFLKRYSEFWGPCNTVVIDSNRDSVAIEKLNCRMGVIFPKEGASYTTSFGYQDPEMQAYKIACDRKYMKLAGITEDSPDWDFWRGCDRRLARLAELVDSETKKGPSLWGLGDIMTDHDVPFPDGICLAGEPAGTGLWTIVSIACMLREENQRMLYWRTEDGRAAYVKPPYLIPGGRVEIKDEWKSGTRPIPAAEEFSEAVVSIQRY